MSQTTVDQTVKPTKPNDEDIAVIIRQNEAYDLWSNMTDICDKAGAMIYILNQLETKHYIYLLPNSHETLLEQINLNIKLADLYQNIKNELKTFVSLDDEKHTRNHIQLYECVVRAKIFSERLTYGFWDALEMYFKGEAEIDTNKVKKAFEYLSKEFPEKLLNSFFDKDVNIQ